MVGEDVFGTHEIRKSVIALAHRQKRRNAEIIRRKKCLALKDNSLICGDAKRVQAKALTEDSEVIGDTLKAIGKGRYIEVDK